MHVQVLDILYDQETHLMMVEFSTPFGTGVGEWRGTPPERYSHHDVEIETGSRLKWGEGVVPVSDDHFVIDYDVDHLWTLQGKLESIEPDGIAYVRIGAGLILVKTEGEPSALDSFVRAKPDKLILFPYEA